MPAIDNIKDAFRTHDILAMTQDDHVIIKCKGTDIVTYDNDEIILSSGGQRDKSVKSRINQAGEFHGLNFHVFQRGKDWLIETPEGRTIKFKDGIKFSRVKMPTMSTAYTAKMTKPETVSIINQLWKIFPAIDNSGEDAKQKLYDLEMREVRSIRAGKKRGNAVSDADAARFLAIKHVYDAMRGETKLTLEDALHATQAMLYASALSISQKDDLQALRVICDTANFKSITWENLNK